MSVRIAEDGSTGGFAQSKGKGSPVEELTATVGCPVELLPVVMGLLVLGESRLGVLVPLVKGLSLLSASS